MIPFQVSWNVIPGKLERYSKYAGTPFQIGRNVIPRGMEQRFGFFMCPLLHVNSQEKTMPGTTQDVVFPVYSYLNRVKELRKNAIPS